MSIKLTPYEKETIIITSEGDDTFSFYTFNANYKRRLAEFSEKHPSHCVLKKESPEGSCTYSVDKKCLSMHLMPPYSEERRQKSREQAKKNGLVCGSNTSAA